MFFKQINDAWVKMPKAATYGAGLVLLVVSYFAAMKPDGGVNTLLLANYYALLAFIFLSLTLLVTPLRVVFPKFSMTPALALAKRHLGDTAFSFAFLDGAMQMWFLFGMDFGKLWAFSAKNGWAQAIGLLALLVLFPLFLTSTDWAVRKLGRRWFGLHKLVYLAYPLIIYHAWKIGIDFKDANAYSIVFLALAAVTVIFEIIRVYKQRFESKAQPP